MMKKVNKFKPRFIPSSIFAISSVNAQESQKDAIEIEEILVSASLIPIVASRSANAITVIDSEQIKLRAAQSVSDLLRDVPGLAVSSYGAWARLRQFEHAVLSQTI